MNMNSYHCKHCRQTVKRESTKQRIKSYCEKTGKRVHLVKVVEQDLRNASDREFWKSVDKIAKSVDSWPEWKREGWAILDKRSDKN